MNSQNRRSVSAAVRSLVSVQTDRSPDSLFRKLQAAMADRDLIELIAADAVAPGQAAEVVAAGRIFAVYNVDGTFYVLDGICPHAGGPLGKGALNGHIVTCPWHGWQFDVQSGQHCLSDHICQTAWTPEIVGGMVCIPAPVH